MRAPSLRDNLRGLHGVDLLGLKRAAFIAALVAAIIAGVAMGSEGALSTGEADFETPSDGLSILLPIRGALAPMPVELGVGRFLAGRLVDPGQVELLASAGELRVRPRRAGEPMVRAVYYPPRDVAGLLPVTIEARAGDDRAHATLNLDSSLVGRVEMRVEPQTLVKGSEAEAAVLVRIIDGSGAPSSSRPPLLTVNVGSVGELERTGSPGEWRTRYQPGPARYPEVAVFAAFSPWPHEDSPALAFGHATLPLAASIDLPGEVRPRVRVEVEIAGESFGPVTSDRLGRFEVPVVVPPGHGVGRGHSVDRFGNRRETEIDLRLPPTNRMTGAVHPTRLVADGEGRARLVVLTVDEFGEPSSEAEPRVEASLGKVGELKPRGTGVFVGWYEPPAGIESSMVVDTIILSLPGDPRSRAELKLTLVSAPPSRIEMAMQPPVVPAPSVAAARIELGVFDELGSPSAGAAVSAAVGRGGLSLGGESSVEIESGDDGILVLDYRPPADAKGWEDRLDVWADSALGDRPASLIFDESEGELAIVDALFRPVAGAHIEIGARSRVADGRGRLGPPPGETSVIASSLPGGSPAYLLLARDELGRTFGVPSRSLGVKSEFALPLMEPVPVDVELELVTGDDGVRKLKWRITGGEGERLVSIHAGSAEPMRFPGRRGEVALALEPGDHVMVVDIETGVSAVLLVGAR